MIKELRRNQYKGSLISDGLLYLEAEEPFLLIR
jgi:hypothetical protein